jgi:hypothetical protein
MTSGTHVGNELRTGQQLWVSEIRIARNLNLRCLRMTIGGADLEYIEPRAWD